MNKDLIETKIRRLKIKCSICDEYFITNIFSNKTYEGGNCFHSLDPKDKTEEWECDNCWGTKFVQI